MARPRSFDETRVLQLARERFWSTGFAGTSIDEVAAATGLGKGSLYGAFGDKRSLYLRVFEGYCTDSVEGAKVALSGSDADAYGRLRAYVLGIAAATAADTEHLGCLLANGSSELAGREPAVVEYTGRTFDGIQEALADCIEAAQRHGDFTPTADPRRHAALLLAVLRGIEALGKGGRDDEALRSVAESALDTLPRA